ncbi:MAG: cytochrome c3 family protein [Bacteroidetes bacterium]|nr:cytochrome c3 family protein [Bacteroidota bacterium]
MRCTKLSLFLFTLVILGCNDNQIVEQPVAYNHTVHLTEAGMDCIDCHLGAETKIHATLPSIKQCKSCHSKSKTESSAEKMVVDAVLSGAEIPWNRIYNLPDHVFFSHRRHVKAGQVACSVCHGEVEKLTKPPSKMIVPISMDTCMNCHDNKSISNDCLTCHV